MLNLATNLWNSDRVRILASAVTGLALISISFSFGDAGSILWFFAFIVSPIIFSLGRSISFKGKYWYDANGNNITSRLPRFPRLTFVVLIIIGLSTHSLMVELWGLLDLPSLIIRDILHICYPALLIHTYLFIKNLPFNIIAAVIIKYNIDNQNSSVYSTRKNWITDSSRRSNDDIYTSPAYSHLPGNVFHNRK